MNQQGFTLQGFTLQGANPQGFTLQGSSSQGFTLQGTNLQGFSPQGFTLQGFTLQGFTLQGFTLQGFTLQGFTLQGFTLQGFTLQGTQFRGIDRARGLAAAVDLGGLAYADVQAPSANLEGLQPPGLGSPPYYLANPGSYATQGINYVHVTDTTTGVRLQASPSATDNGAGSYIQVPGLSGTANDIKGTLWNMVLTDATGATGGIGLYVSDVGTDTMSNLSTSPSNDDVYLYTVYYRQPSTQQWTSLCPVDPKTGKATAMAIPLDPNDWGATSRTKFTFACTASGVGAKCARNWGYKPWKTVAMTMGDGSKASIPLKPFYDACLIAARADYCQNGTSYTKNGTLVDLFDTIDPLTSLNPTAGLPYAPGATGPMMHEEYEISALDLSTAATTQLPDYALDAATLDMMSLSPEDRAALAAVRRSGLQSSRYAELDPGRACPAAPYIDRCDPHEPYACYRATNLSPNSYGAFLSVNSPRHCDHDEDTPGAALDPLCNLCVTRVCSVDPSCCGDPGATNFYPGSLVWDARCSDIRKQVCRSTPQASAPWAAGAVAPVAGSTPVVILRGAMGSFEGISTVAGQPYAEGWACDPDFPGASSFVQISMGGTLGTAGTKLYTARADGPLATGWREDVAAECGGVGRHGFRFPLPAMPPGTDGNVYVYGIDMNTPGAPFSLLRGGKKPLPAAALPKPQAAIWTGWLEPTVSGPHVFSVLPGAGDQYRIWVNGQYVLGQWTTVDPNAPAFSATPAPTLNLLAGVRYGVRIEYLRPAADGNLPLTLQWAVPSQGVPTTTATTIPTNALYPMAQSTGTGLLGTYFRDAYLTDPPSATSVAPVDFVWSSCAQGTSGGCSTSPGGTVPVDQDFSARFVGQVMPPVSGNYTFTADTDGAASIWVNGTLVTDASRKLPSGSNPDTCTHDICHTGAAISRTCDQGYFCSAEICKSDPVCCSETWDAQCVQEVASICNTECNPTPPVSVSLQAGVKSDIRVELKHPAAFPPSRGATMRLRWALEGGTPDTIPANRLFAETTAPKLGVGLNAAYFSDAAWANEYLDHVDAMVTATTKPTLSVAVSDMVSCGAACNTGDVLGPPALAFASGTHVSGPTVTITGGGAVANASVTVAISLPGHPPTPVTTASATAGADGTFSVGPISLASNAYEATVMQSAGGKTSLPTSPPVEFTVFDYVDPTLPAPPTVTVPQGGFVAVNGKVTVTGTSAPSAKVTVTGGAAPVTVTASSSGAWTAAIVLSSPGLYTLSVSQTPPGGKASPGATVSAKYAVPDLLSVTAPPSIETTFTTGSVLVSGQAAPGLTNSQLIVGDGDGRTFNELVLTPSQFNPATGAFSATLTFDTGRHVLKIFQRNNGLDGDAVLRSFVIKPTTAGPSIQCPVAGADGRADVTVTNLPGSGAPPRSGFSYGIAIYDNATTKIGEGTPADDGSFSVVAHLAVVGAQTITARLLVSSLSGGGTAESADGPPCAVSVTPAPPSLGLTSQTTTAASFKGSALAGANVLLFIDGTLKTSTKLAPTATSFTFASVAIPAGYHRVTATQTVGGATSLASPPVLVGMGDVTPPSVQIGPSTLTPPYRVTAQAPDDIGTKVDYATLIGGITATDAGKAVAVKCVPATNTFFYLGTTNVTCSAVDAAGNSATASLAVTVTSAVNPTVNGTDVFANATSAAGAAVSYHVSATGFVADCAPPGSAQIVPCTEWHPENTGLGFEPTSLAADPLTGALYAIDTYIDLTGIHGGTLYTSTNHGASWTVVPTPQRILGRPAVAPGAPATSTTPAVPSTLYLSVLDGVLASTDGGVTTTMVLPGFVAGGFSVDPLDPGHVYTWNFDFGGAGGSWLALFETIDGGRTWSNAAEGLPIENGSIFNQHITGVVFDSLNPGRAYLEISPHGGQDSRNPTPEIICRKVGKAPWERRPIPPVTMPGRRSGESAIGVAPHPPACAPGATCYAPVFTGNVMSLDGGETWTQIPGLDYGLSAIAFDARYPDHVYAMDQFRLMISTTTPPSFVAPPVPQSMPAVALVQDPSSPDVLFAALDEGAYGHRMLKGGLSTAWSAVSATDAAAGPLSFVYDLAFDPVNADAAYLLAPSGLFKHEVDAQGFGKWELRTSGIPAGFDVMPTVDRITIDPFKSQTIYLSGNFEADTLGLVSTDGAGDQSLPWSTMSPATNGLLAPDPGIQNVFLGALPNTVGQPTSPHNIVRRYASGASTQYAFSDPNLSPLDLQVFPDAARTAALTSQGTELGTVLFSARDALPSPSTTFVHIATSGTSAKPVFDNSDGQDTLYVSGDAIGSTPDVLYEAAVSDLDAASDSTWKAAWHRVAGGQAWMDFRRFKIDPGGGGRVMYTLGTDDGLWQSEDGGESWSEDARAPSFLKQVWASPTDGALYATVNSSFASTDFDRRVMGYAPWAAAGNATLWKRVPSTIPPQGASIVEGSLRVRCSVAGGTRAVTSGSMFPIGTTNLVCTATDVFGHGTSKTIGIHVADNTAPVITVPAPVTATTSSTSAIVTYVATATDAVDGPLAPTAPTTASPAFYCQPASGTAFALGVTKVTCTARDKTAHAAAASFNVTVVKTGATALPPTLNVPGDLTVDANVQTSTSGGATITAQATATTSKGVALPTPTCSPLLTTTFPMGPTVVTCTTADSGFTIARSFTVTVVDKSPPVFGALPAPSATAQGAWGAHVSFTVTANDIVDHVVTPSCSPASGSTFAPGTTTVTCRAADKAGNISTAELDVVVSDPSPPVLKVPPLLVAEATDFLGARVGYNVTATDTKDGVIVPDCAPTTGSWFPMGDSSVSCQATDSDANTVRATFIVRVVDTTPPTVTVPYAPVTVEVTPAGGAPAPFAVSAYDLVTANLTPTCSRANGVDAATTVISGSVFPVGDTLVTCTAVDGAGNVGTNSFHVVVGDHTPPSFPPQATIYAQTGPSGTAVVKYTEKPTDLGAPVPFSCTPASGSTFLFGTTPVTCVARDGAGNEGRLTFNVVVRDAVAPVFQKMALPPTVYATSVAGAPITYATPIATDAYEGARPVTCAPASGSTFAPNKTTVTCTAADTSGNKATTTFTEWVQFNTTLTNGATFMSPLNADGSSTFTVGATIPVSIALLGASAPITNLVAHASLAPVVSGVVGTFAPAPSASGSDLFVYDAANTRTTFNLVTGALGPGVYRVHAELGDGVTREVNFTLTAMSFTLTPSSFNFGNVVIGQAGPTAAFTIQNVSSAPLNVGSVLTPLVGTIPEFPIVANTCGTTTMAPGGFCTMAIRLTPMTPGPKNATLTMVGPGGSLTAQLTGMGWRPAQLVASPPTAAFGNLPLLTPSAAIDVSVTNLGDQPTGMLNVTITGPDFMIMSNQCPTSLPGSQTCHVFVRFVPTALGSRTANLTIGAGPGGTANVALAGAGIPPLVISPPTATFPGVRAGTAGAVQVFTVSSMSAAPSAPLTTAASPAAFRITANTCAGRSISPGVTCQVTVQWFPVAVGTVGGSLTINGAAGWSAAAALTGTGT